MSDHESDDKTIIADMGSRTPQPKTSSVASLVQYSGTDMGKRHILKGTNLKVGRAATNEVTIGENSVSRVHAIIFQEGDAVYIEDAGSANGTYVNEQKIEGKRSLNDQDMIGLGAVLLKFFAHDNMDGFIQDKMYQKATIDVGTQIYNKLYLMEALEAEFRGSQKGGRPLTLVYFDLDHFKKVNDTYGHNAGDQVLRETADLIKTKVRKDDTFARFGGEEFVIILPRTELQPGYNLAEGVRKALEDYVFVLTFEKDGTKQTVQHKQTISLGVAQMTQEMQIPKDLLEAADKKLYLSKTSGRNRVTF